MKKKKGYFNTSLSIQGPTIREILNHADHKLFIFYLKIGWNFLPSTNHINHQILSSCPQIVI